MSKPLSRGVHHLALNTDDMKMTLDFYLRVLGMPLVHALRVPPGLGTGPGNRGNPPFENIRHYFLDAGGDSLLAFFEIPKGAKPRGDRDAIGTMQHVSFAVSEQKFNDVLNRIRNARIEYLGPVNVGCETYSIYFLDPNGIRLEFSHHKETELLNTYCWNDVWNRPGLPRKMRSVLNLGMLTALGKEHELKLHLNGALNNGLTREEIKEVLLQTAIYCGVPAAVVAFRCAREVFKDRKA